MMDNKDKAMLDSLFIQSCNALMEYMVYSDQCGYSLEDIDANVRTMVDCVADDFQSYIEANEDQ